MARDESRSLNTLLVGVVKDLEVVVTNVISDKNIGDQLQD